uniref:Uncharacterized protein n=1 Tax=Anguilla anguilla TaxID=7936 RepID=A0A0E9R2L8_ANGAN
MFWACTEQLVPDFILFFNQQRYLSFSTCCYLDSWLAKLPP